LAGWRAVADHLVRPPRDAARQEAAAILQSLPQELRSPRGHCEPARWIPNPTGLHRICEAAMRRLIALPVDTPSPRLLADKAAEVLAGMAYALDGLALFVDDPLGLSRAAWRRSTARARLAARLWLMPDVQSRHLDGLLTQCTGDNALVIAALTQDRRNRMAQAIGVSPRCSRAARLPV
jgi:hypothetical protein